MPVTSASLAVLLIVLPLSTAVAGFVIPRLARALAIVAAIAILAGVVSLAAGIGADGPVTYRIGGWDAPLGINLYADGLAVFMLLTAALTGVAVSLYGARYFTPGSAEATAFWPLWMLLWTALNALFLSGDVFNLYVTLELMGLSAVVLVAIAGGEALTGAMRYLLMTMTASLAYLLGVALLYHQTATLDITLLGEAATADAPVWIALGLMIAALLVKSALFPLHFWLPFAHASAPVPVSALLSALVVKATLYLLLRLWLEVLPHGRNALGPMLAALGALAILWGSLQALRQANLKLLVAYSTVAQLGYLFLPFSIRAADAAAAAWRGALYFLLCHALAKSTMFMAAGNLTRAGGSEDIGGLRLTAAQAPLSLAAFGIGGITIIGLPPSGGFLAKWMLLEAAFAARQWWLAAVLLAGGLLSAAYVFKVVGLAFTEEGGTAGARPPSGYLEWVALALALATLALGFLGPPLLALLDVGDPFARAALPAGAPVVNGEPAP